jgi:4-oxalocrotonate tautomerase
MPIVHVDLMTGRSPEALASMMQEVSEAIARTLDAPIETVRIIVNEMQPHLYGVGGKPWPAIVEERRTAADDA